MSPNPPEGENVSREGFKRAVAQIERQLDLEDHAPAEAEENHYAQRDLLDMVA
ncbi:MAG: hypothetical protein PF480_10500 [Roseovarius sp.]|jgi:hypothetical protein|nr:hypothetical protein [Roseovarius sp.]